LYNIHILFHEGKFIEYLRIHKHKIMKEDNQFKLFNEEKKEFEPIAQLPHGFLYLDYSCSCLESSITISQCKIMNVFTRQQLLDKIKMVCKYYNYYDTFNEDDDVALSHRVSFDVYGDTLMHDSIFNDKTVLKHLDLFFESCEMFVKHNEQD